MPTEPPHENCIIFKKISLFKNFHYFPFKIIQLSQTVNPKQSPKHDFQSKNTRPMSVSFKWVLWCSDEPTSPIPAKKNIDRRVSGKILATCMHTRSMADKHRRSQKFSETSSDGLLHYDCAPINISQSKSFSLTMLGWTTESRKYFQLI
jgi:hypothetical protein